MKTVLDDLFFGEIQPNINDYREDSHIQSRLQTIIQNEEILLKLLDGKERRLFIDLMNAQSEVDGASAAANFVNGFKLGAKIIAKSLLEH